MLLRSLLLSFVCGLLSGCLSSKYKLVSKQAVPAVQLHLVASGDSIDAALQSVVVHRGPGSWKREAYWDEYAIALHNRGTVPVTVESAALIDFQGNANAPGADPWKLEAESKTWWQQAKSSQAGNLLVLGAGAVGVTTVLAGGAILAAGGIFAPATATSLVLGNAAIATIYGAPAYAVAVVVINSRNKRKVTEEFQRRRMALPVTVSPGEIRQGSFFFRISPSPQRLHLQFRSGKDEPPVDLVMDLAPLSGLHMKAGKDEAK